MKQNKLIDGLIEKAGLDCDECAFLGPNLQEFAELIVKECIHMMKIATSGPDETTPELRVQEFCIKQHFGIKE